MKTMQKPTVCLSLFVFAVVAAPFVPAQPGVQAGTQAAASQAASKDQPASVVLPVNVHDKKGALVTTLQKSDLTLTEDGRPQTIQSLTRESTLPWRVGLLVDTSHAMSGALSAERAAATKFVDALLPAGETKDQMFLIHFDREVELLEDFTSARDKLHTELDDLGPTHQERNDTQGPETAGDDRSSGRRGKTGTQLYDAIYLASDELMKSKNGRKALVIFSDGADRGSKETLNDAVDAADKANLAIYTVFMKGEQTREQNPFGQQGQQRRGGMGGGWPGGGGGYPGGGGGRRAPEPTAANGIDGKKIMQEIATRTGGHAYEAKKTSDLEPIYKLIEEELHGQYLLTYTPDKLDKDGGFHKTVVTPNNKDLTVSTREGYYAPER